MPVLVGILLTIGLAVLLMILVGIHPLWSWMIAALAAIVIVRVTSPAWRRLMAAIRHAREPHSATSPQRIAGRAQTSTRLIDQASPAEPANDRRRRFSGRATLWQSRRNRGTLTVAAALVLLLAIVLPVHFVTDAKLSNASLLPTTPTTSGTATNYMPWSEAQAHVGETCVLEGPVISTAWAQESEGQPTFLNVGRPYPDPERLAVVIWGEDRENFPFSPETEYAGKTIRVTGVVEAYQDYFEVIVYRPSQIEILGGP